MKYLFLFTICIVLCFTSNSEAKLQTYLDKYDDKSPPASILKKVKRYDHLINFYAKYSYIKPRYKVSPKFITALIMAESAGDSNATSNKKAMGLGQIILTTGQQAGRELAATGFSCKYVTNKKLKNITKSDLYRPSINILLTYYLVAKYNILFDGRLDLVISAWNAGENTPSLKKNKHAPYKETENLIAKVNSYYVYLLKNP